MLEAKERYADHAIIVYKSGFAARVTSIFEEGFVEKQVAAHGNGNDIMNQPEAGLVDHRGRPLSAVFLHDSNPALLPSKSFLRAREVVDGYDGNSAHIEIERLRGPQVFPGEVEQFACLDARPAAALG